ncbi:hypothetical protein [Caproiciproducens sp. LBM24188]
MNRKSAWIISAAALIACLPIRLYQIFCLSDQGTGFYTDGGTSTWILVSVLAIGVILTVVMSLCDREAPKSYSPIRSIPLAVFGVLSGIGLVGQSFISLAADAGRNHIMYMILFVLGILAGVVLIFFAYDFATGQNHFERNPLPSLFPTLWSCACLVALFLEYVAVVNIADNIYNIITVIFLLLFFFAQAKLLSGVEREKSGRMAYVFGIPAALLCLLTGVADTAALAGTIGRPEGTFPTGLHIVTIVFAVYILVFLAAFRRAAAKEKEVPASQPVVDELVPSEEPMMMSQWKNCVDLLEKEYHSEIRFREKTESPFAAAETDEI